MKNKSNYYQIKNLQQKNQKNNFNINKNKKGINIKENNLRKSIENNENIFNIGKTKNNTLFDQYYQYQNKTNKNKIKVGDRSNNNENYPSSNYQNINENIYSPSPNNNDILTQNNNNINNDENILKMLNQYNEERNLDQNINNPPSTLDNIKPEQPKIKQEYNIITAQEYTPKQQPPLPQNNPNMEYNIITAQEYLPKQQPSLPQRNPNMQYNIITAQEYLPKKSPYHPPESNNKQYNIINQQEIIPPQNNYNPKINSNKKYNIITAQEYDEPKQYEQNNKKYNPNQQKYNIITQEEYPNNNIYNNNPGNKINDYKMPENEYLPDNIEFEANPKPEENILNYQKTNEPNPIKSSEIKEKDKEIDKLFAEYIAKYGNDENIQSLINDYKKDKDNFFNSPASYEDNYYDYNKKPSTQKQRINYKKEGIILPKINKNYIKDNRDLVINNKIQSKVKPKGKEPSAIHKDFGKTPDYIKKYKIENSIKKEEKKRRLEEAKYPKGTKLLSEEERISTLNGLIQTKKDLNTMLEKMPITTRTMAVQQKKEELIHKIEEVEKGIDMFSKKQVFVKI